MLELNELFAMGPKICTTPTYAPDLARFFARQHLGLLASSAVHLQPLSHEPGAGQIFGLRYGLIGRDSTKFASQYTPKNVPHGPMLVSGPELPALMCSSGTTQPCMSVARGLLLTLLSPRWHILFARSVAKAMQ